MQNNNVHKVWRSWLLLFLLTAPLWQSCSDDDDSFKPDPDNVTLSEEEVLLTSKAQYYTLQVEGDLRGWTIDCSSDASWVTFDADTVPSDGYFDFYVSRDEEEVERTATVTVSLHSDLAEGRELTCRVIQSRDNGDNAGELPIQTTFRVGYGYDIYGLYDNDISVKESILNQNVLSSSEYADLVSVSECQSLSLNSITTRTLVEMASELTESKVVTTTTIVGGSKTTSTYSTNGNASSEDEQYVHTTLSNTYQIRALDTGMLNMFVESGNNIFTEDFKTLRQRIIANHNDTEALKLMFNKYGTHLIVYAELGGKIELSYNFSGKMTGALDMRAEDFTNYFFRNQSSSYLTATGKIQDMTTTINTNTNCIVSGGSSAATTALKNAINKNGRATKIELDNWLASLSNNLVAMNFQLLPIWYLFPSECHATIIKAIQESGQSSKNSSYIVGSDYYQIPLTDAMLTFGSGSDNTLVKVFYASIDNSSTLTPLLEICEEYVPHIRGDKRVPIIYPIRNGRPYIGGGLFPGDAEGNPPAWVTFSDDQVYIRPIDDTSSTERLQTLYYFHGNLYETDYNLTIVQQLKKTKVEDQYLKLRENKKYPIVKIASGYWMRKNVEETMEFIEDPDYDDGSYWYDMFTNGNRNVYYQGIFYTNSESFLGDVSLVYGPAIDATTKERTLWYLPKNQDILNLQSYIDLNPKALLQNQVSGFEATFDGCYGKWDDINNISYNKYQVSYRNTHCFIPCKNEESSKNGYALILSKDYKLFTSAISQATENEYPVRLYRTAYWKYNNIK